MLSMENITLKHLREVAKLKDIADAFGVSISLIKQWEYRYGDIPQDWRDKYSLNRAPVNKPKALKLYKRALKSMRQANV